MNESYFDIMGGGRITLWKLIDQGDLLCQRNHSRMNRFPKKE